MGWSGSRRPKKVGELEKGWTTQVILHAVKMRIYKLTSDRGGRVGKSAVGLEE